MEVSTIDIIIFLVKSVSNWFEYQLIGLFTILGTRLEYNLSNLFGREAKLFSNTNFGNS